jgi:hypothetical protein
LDPENELQYSGPVLLFSAKPADAVRICAIGRSDGMLWIDGSGISGFPSERPSAAGISRQKENGHGMWGLRASVDHFVWKS